MGLFRLFKEESKRTFEPPPPQPAPTQRNLEGRIIDPQTQSAFITKLPPEIRNRIYELAFKNGGLLQSNVGPTRPERQEGQISTLTPSLHLLLTCRLINDEATVLAFSTYTFTPSDLLTQHLSLRNATLHLRPAQFAAISRLAIDRGEDHFTPYQRRHASDFISKILLVFPGVTSIELRCQRGGHGPYSTQIHTHAMYTAELHTPEDHLLNAHCEKKGEMPVEGLLARHLPRWFQIVVCDVVRGRIVKWKKGCGWRVRFPQLGMLVGGFEGGKVGVENVEVDDEGWELVPVSQERDEQDGDICFVPRRDAEDHLTEWNEITIWEKSVATTTTPSPSRTARPGPLPALVPCLCDCRIPTLTHAQLLQDTTGRSVDITVIYTPSKLELEAMKRTKEENDRYYFLKAGAERLPVVEVGGGRALRWDGEEAFWEGLRRKNEGWLRRKNKGWLGR